MDSRGIRDSRFAPTIISQNLQGQSRDISISNKEPPNTGKELAQPPEEQFYGNDQTPGYDMITEQCGGSVSNLRKNASIKRLLPTCKTYNNIREYVQNSTDDKQINVKAVYKIQRFADKIGKIDESFRILLWHGTSPNAVPGIIETGFRKGKAGMFGSGIYFADRIAKSIVYATKNSEGSAFFVLAEVYPGNMYKAHHFHTNYKTPPKGFDSVKGNGSDIPKWKGNKDYFGAIMPCGQTCPNRRHDSYDMKYNEYILYDMDRVFIRFIVECTF